MTSVTLGDFIRYTRALRVVNLCPDDFGLNSEEAFYLWLARDTKEGLSLIENIQKCLDLFPNSDMMFSAMRNHPEDVHTDILALQQQCCRVILS